MELCLPVRDVLFNADKECDTVGLRIFIVSSWGPIIKNFITVKKGKNSWENTCSPVGIFNPTIAQIKEKVEGRIDCDE